MKRANRRRRYNIEELVTAAYRAARQVTCNRLLASILVSKILEEWLERANRQDLLKELQGTSCKRALRPVRVSSRA
jgi:hypothetical protein